MITVNAQNACLEYVADNGANPGGTQRLVLCSTEPTTHAEVGSNELAAVGLTPGDGNGDWTIQAGDVSGRKLTLAAQTVTGSANGTAAAWAIVDDTGSELLAAHTMTQVEIVNGNTQDTQAVDVAEARDPA